MIKQLKQFTLSLIAGANVATILMMLATGFSDRLNPVDHPLLSSAGMLFPLPVLLNIGFLLLWIVVKWRRTWIPIAGFLLAFQPIRIYMPLNARQTLPEGCIKLVTYNVCDYGGNYKYEDGFERIVGYLKEQDADIVCIQEDVDTWRRYMFDHYRKLYPYNDTTVLARNATTMNAVGIHTRYPIVRKERIAYESNGNGSVAYYLQVGGDTLLVINNHLEGTHLSKEDRARYKDMLRGGMERDTAKAESMLLIDKLGQSSAKRAPQADIVRRYVEEHSQYPAIVCGDFNDTPISYTRRTMARGLTDCYVESGRGIGLSYNQKGFWVRIDNVLCTSHFTPYNCHVDSKIDFSDHYPMVCWLKMKDK